MQRTDALTPASQFLRYAFAGGLTNLAAYLLFLWLAFIGLDPRIAVTISFPVGVLMGFSLNRNLTFQDRGDPRRALTRYLVAYVTAYIVDIIGLYVFATVNQYPHEIVQLGLMVLISGGLFLTQKYWVFVADRHRFSRPGSKNRDASR